MIKDLSNGLKLFTLFASVSKEFLRVQFYYCGVEDGGKGYPADIGQE